MGSSLASWLYRHVSLIKLDLVVAGTTESGSEVGVVGTGDVGVVVEVGVLNGAVCFAGEGRTSTFGLVEVRATPAAAPPQRRARVAAKASTSLNRLFLATVRIGMMSPSSGHLS